MRPIPPTSGSRCRSWVTFNHDLAMGLCRLRRDPFNTSSGSRLTVVANGYSASPLSGDRAARLPSRRYARTLRTFDAVGCPARHRATLADRACEWTLKPALIDLPPSPKRNLPEHPWDRVGNYTSSRELHEGIARPEQARYRFDCSRVFFH